jgi:L-fucose isomerase-like protein
MPECDILPVASALHGELVVAGLVDSVLNQPLGLGVRIVTAASEARPTAPMAVLVVTGGVERAVLDAWRARQTLAPGEPLLLLTHDGHNSLPAALEALARVQLDGGRGRIVTLRHDAQSERHEHEEFVAAVRDLMVWHALQQARIGMVGEASDWLVASAPEPAGVQRRWGPTFVEVPISEVMERFDENIDAPLAVPVQLRAHATSHTPHPADIETAARFEPVLQQTATDLRLDAVAVRCFDLVLDAHTSGCLALSSLNDHGVIAGCEGDLASTLGMLWGKLLTGQLGWMANPAGADRSTGVIELAHCTVPLSLVEDYELDTHFESGRLPSGDVTLLRLGGRELEHLWCVDGQALRTTPREGRCRTQLDVRVAPFAVAEMLDHPLGNHLVVLFGHHANNLQHWWKEMIANAPIAV